MANLDTISNSHENLSESGIKTSSSQNSIKKDAAILDSRVSRDKDEFESINHMDDIADTVVQGGAPRPVADEPIEPEDTDRVMEMNSGDICKTQED